MNTENRRNEWEFEYLAGALAEAAKAKVVSHTGRKEWWEKKFKEVIAKVPEGIEVHDSLASSYSNTKGRYGAEIVIDPTVQRDLAEAQGKIREHAPVNPPTPSGNPPRPKYIQSNI